MKQITEAEYQALLADRKDLAAGKEIVGDLMAFLDANIEQSGNGHIDITASKSHADSLCALMNGFHDWLGTKTIGGSND